MLNEFEVSIETVEEVSVVGTVQDSAGLTNGVHSPHRCPQVDRLDAGLARDDRANRRAAWRIIPDHEFAYGYSDPVSHSLHEGRGDQVGGVSLVHIDFDDNSLVDLDGMIRLVFFGVVGVNTVSHVSRDQEGALDCLFEAIACYVLTLSQ